MSDVSEYFRDNTLSRDLFAMVVGDHVGSGAFRQVFEYLPDPTCVIKFETQAQSFSNVREWELWQDAMHVPEAKAWLAPCVDISPCGTALVQKKTAPAREGEFPEKVPAWLTDLKRENFGILGKRLVAHDYANNLATSVGLTKRLRKAEWW